MPYADPVKRREAAVARARARQQRLKAAGRCQVCGVPSGGDARCPGCMGRLTYRLVRRGAPDRRQNGERAASLQWALYEHRQRSLPEEVTI